MEYSSLQLIFLSFNLLTLHNFKIRNYGRKTKKTKDNNTEENKVINQRNILGVSLIFSFAIYMIFGKASDGSDVSPEMDRIIELWDSYYFCIWDFLIIHLSRLVLKSYRDKLDRIIIKVFVGITSVKLLLNLYSFIDMDVFDKINTSSEAWAGVVSCIVVFLIYRSNGMVKTKV